jgi:hypothetical protein
MPHRKTETWTDRVGWLRDGWQRAQMHMEEKISITIQEHGLINTRIFHNIFLLVVVFS